MKKITYIFFTLVCSLALYSQQTIGNYQIDKQILSYPTSPNAYAMDKVGKLPMDLFNGKANISLPIYSIETGDLSIPVNLTYNTGGIKQNEIASTVGLGWALSIPNTITKSIFDKDDDLASLFFKDINHATSILTNIDPNNASQQESLDFLNTGQYDLKPDLYSYNLPGLSGSFIINNNLGYTIPHEDIKIEKVAPSFKISDTKGTVYWLSIRNFVVSKGVGTQPQTSRNLFLVDSIKTAGGKLVKFEYLKQQKYKEKTKYEKKYIITAIDNHVPPGFESFPYLNPNPPMVENSENNIESLITKIVFPEGEVNFLYSGDESLQTTPDAMYRKDLNSDTGGLALKRIIVKNSGGEIVRKVTLNYSYFEPTGSNSTYEGYRLKLLEKVDDLNNTKHIFTYNEEKILPARNGNSDDLYGYFNTTTTSNTNLPAGLFIPGDGYGRNRRTDSTFTQLGVLTGIKYPTGAIKRLYYENNRYSFSVTGTEHHTEILGEMYTDTSIHPELYTLTETKTIDPLYQNVKYNFLSDCTNNTSPPPIPEGPFTVCSGTITSNNMPSIGFHLNGSSGVINNTGQPITLQLKRAGNCTCQISLFREYDETWTAITEEITGGLRVKRIEDIDQANVSNVFYYDYNKSGTLKKQFSYYKPYFRVAEPKIGLIPGQGSEESPVSGQDYVHKVTEVQTAGNAFTSYNSSNIVTYSEVTERNGLGETIYTFTDDKNANSIYRSGNEAYISWKYGLPLKTIYKKGSDTLRKEVFSYEFNPLKNTKSGFTMGNPDEIAFGMDLFLAKYHTSHGLNPDLTSYELEYYPVSIYGGAIEKKQSKITEYFKNNKVVETVTDYTYSDTDINKPINLMSMKNTYKDGSFDITGYSYAHDQVNQLMIDRNMIGIPLEITTTQTLGGTTKTLGKTKTIYPTSLPTTQTGNLLLPTSSVSYDLQFPTVVSAQILYDKYDSKGHPLQYTTKDGISTAIIWGYNNTQPIAQITGAKLSDISQSLINAIVSASDSDAAAIQNNDESAFLSALNTFRNHTTMAGYQITTYTYDPLIGVRSITPPSGVREVYLYDSAKRLMEIREGSQSGKLLKEFKYHYKN